MSDTQTPTYAGADGTYLDVLPAPDDAQYGSVVLDVSGQPVTIAPLAVVRVSDFLQAPQPGVELRILFGDDDDSPVLTFSLEEHGIEVRHTLADRIIALMTIARDWAYVIGATIVAVGTGCT
jgi:hypothetical protein